MWRQGESRTQAFSHNKRTTDLAIGPLWHFLESITYTNLRNDKTSMGELWENPIDRERAGPSQSLGLRGALDDVASKRGEEPFFSRFNLSGWRSVKVHSSVLPPNRPQCDPRRFR